MIELSWAKQYGDFTMSYGLMGGRSGRVNAWLRCVVGGHYCLLCFLTNTSKGGSRITTMPSMRMLSYSQIFSILSRSGGKKPRAIAPMQHRMPVVPTRVIPQSPPGIRKALGVLGCLWRRAIPAAKTMA